jgi:lambda family phage portal protein
MSDKRARGNWIDSAISYFSPESGFRRMQYRRMQEHIRKYEAANAGRRNDRLITRNTSANAEVGPALHRVRDRVRELVRNNPHAGKAVSELESALIGTGIMSTINVSGANRLQSRLRGLWKDWAESTDCDVDGVNNFYGLQALAIRSMVEGGEALIIRKWRKKSDGYRIPVPFQLQVLEGDYIDTDKNIELDNGGYIRNGVEFDSQNRRVAYWLYNHHPGERFIVALKSSTFVSERVDIKDVIHLYRVDRSGQVRGMSWGAACVVRTQDLDAYEDAQLLRQRIAACFAGFIRDMEMPSDTTAADIQMPDRIEAGAMEILPPGKTIEFPNLPQVANDGHAERVLRSIAAGWQVPYEVLTGDFSHVNYSSYRAAMISFKRNVARWQWLMIIPRFNTPVHRWFIEACDIGLGLPVTSSNTRALYTTPRFELMDPSKEVPAIVTAIRSGLLTLPEAIREQGYDPEDQITEIAAFNKKLDDAEVILDSDPRRTMKAGIFQPQHSAVEGQSLGDGGDGANSSGSDA